MRRKDREVTDNTKINQIIKSCNYCRLGFNDNGRVYIVPMNFGYEELPVSNSKSSEQMIKNKTQASERSPIKVFYFHCAREGRKVRLIKETGYAAFELDCGYELLEGESPCTHSAKFQSVIGEGNIVVIENKAEKIHALNCIMKQAAGKSDFQFLDSMLNTVFVFKLEVTEISCKEHI